jgi:hypothetical protein
MSNNGKTEIQVERYRPAAVALRSQDPDLYWQILQTAKTHQCDPDAYVAVFLSVPHAPASSS